MKKTMLLAAFATLVLHSCISDDTVHMAPPNASVIGLDPYAGKSGRATDITGDRLRDFNVWGRTWNPTDDRRVTAAVFDGTEVTRQGEGAESTWTYNPLRYWMIGNNYTFTAIAPANAPGVSVSLNTDYPEDIAEVDGDITLTFDNALAEASTDLLYAFKTQANADAQTRAVALTFSHLLSRVMFTFENGFPSAGMYLRVSNVMITDAIASGTIDQSLTPAKWIPSTGEESVFAVQFAPKDPGAEQKFNNASHWTTTNMYLIPDQSAAGRAYQLTFTVTTYNYNPANGDFVLGNSYDKVAVIPAIPMEPNMSYNFTTVLNELNTADEEMTPISFIPTVEAWGEFKSGGTVAIDTGE